MRNICVRPKLPMRLLSLLEIPHSLQVIIYLRSVTIIWAIYISSHKLIWLCATFMSHGYGIIYRQAELTTLYVIMLIWSINKQLTLGLSIGVTIHLHNTFMIQTRPYISVQKSKMHNRNHTMQVIETCIDIFGIMRFLQQYKSASRFDSGKWYIGWTMWLESHVAMSTIHY